MATPDEIHEYDESSHFVFNIDDTGDLSDAREALYDALQGFQDQEDVGYMVRIHAYHEDEEGNIEDEWYSSELWDADFLDGWEMDYDGIAGSYDIDGISGFSIVVVTR